MAFCTVCGAQTQDGSTVCPACSGSGAAAVRPAQAATGGLTDNVAGMLAYVTIIPAIIFLIMEPYNRSRFVRFHAFQFHFFRYCVDRFVDRAELYRAHSFPRLVDHSDMAADRIGGLRDLDRSAA